MARLPAVLVLLGASLAPGAIAADRPPRYAFQVRVGWSLPAGGGDVHDGNAAAFGLDASDLAGPTVGVGFVMRVASRWEFGVGVDATNGSARSAYIDYDDGAGGAVTHDTEWTRFPLTVDVRYLPWGRKTRAPGGGAPATVWFGGGIGVTFWEYEESGRFLDFAFAPPLPFTGRFRAGGRTFGAHLLVGVDLALGRRTDLLFQLGYGRAEEDEIGDDLAGLGTLELGGAALTVGGAWRW